MLDYINPRIDTPEAYQPLGDIYPEERLVDSADFAQKRENYTSDQENQLNVESHILDIDPDDDPDLFVAAHNKLLADMEAKLTTYLPTVKHEVIKRTAAYFASDDETAYKHIIELLTDRLAATKQVLIRDDLVIPMELYGAFPAHRQPLLASHELTWQMYLGNNDMDDFRAPIVGKLLTHEVMHGVFTSGTDAEGFTTIRNGLRLTPPRQSTGDPIKDTVLEFQAPSEELDYGSWLSEGALESFRGTLFSDPDLGYQPNVMVLHMLNALSPGLRDRMVLAALDRQGPASEFAEVEAMMGPNAIMDIGRMINQVTAFSDNAIFKHHVVALLPRELQARGKVILDQQEAEIFKADQDYQDWLQSGE